MIIPISGFDPAIRVAPLVAHLLDEAEAWGLDVRALRIWLRAPFSRREHVQARIAVLTARRRSTGEEAELCLARLIAVLPSLPASDGFATLHVGALEALHALEQPEEKAA